MIQLEFQYFQFLPAKVVGSDADCYIVVIAESLILHFIFSETIHHSTVGQDQILLKRCKMKMRCFKFPLFRFQLVFFNKVT